MALKDLLKLQNDANKQGISEERTQAILPIVKQYMSFWREYPDMMVDFLVRGQRQEVKEGEFAFYFYQRVFLRAIFRYQYVYAVYPRA